MPELSNSTRNLLRATYTTIPAQSSGNQAGRAFPKTAAIANIRITEAELRRLREDPTVDLSALRAVETVVRAKSSVTDPNDVAGFAKVDAHALANIASTVAK